MISHLKHLIENISVLLYKYIKIIITICLCVHQLLFKPKLIFIHVNDDTKSKCKVKAPAPMNFFLQVSSTNQNICYKGNQDSNCNRQLSHSDSPFTPNLVYGFQLDKERISDSKITRTVIVMWKYVSELKKNRKCFYHICIV